VGLRPPWVTGGRGNPKPRPLCGRRKCARDVKIISGRAFRTRSDRGPFDEARPRRGISTPSGS
jgi:hypothetical protein